MSLPELGVHCFVDKPCRLMPWGPVTAPSSHTDILRKAGQVEDRALGFCPCQGRECVFVVHLNAGDFKHQPRGSIPNKGGSAWLVSLTRAWVLQTTGSPWAPGTECLKMEIFASINWVSEQRQRHLTSIYFATPPPATAPSLFFRPSKLS